MNKITFKDLPSTETPINAENLNLMQENIESAVTENAEKIDNLETQMVTTEGKVLYENTSGSAEDITLTDSSANYDYIEIFFRTNDRVYNSTKVYSPNGKTVDLTSVFAHYNSSEGMRVYIKVKIVTINESIISQVTANEIVSAAQVKITNSAVTSGASNNIHITRVVGYKS